MNLFKKFNRNVLLFASGQALSIIGDSAETMALAWWVLSATGSAAAVAKITVPGIVLRLILTPLLGPLADRYSRKKMLVVSDFAKFVLFLLIALLSLQPQFNSILLASLYTLASIFGAIFSAAAGGFVPSLVSREEIPTAIQQTSLLQTIAGVSGGLIGGVVVSALGIFGAMFINSLSFLISMLSLLLISQKFPVALDKSTSFSKGVSIWWKDLKDGFSFVVGFPPLAGSMIIFTAINFFASWLTVALPALVKASTLGVKYLGIIESVGMVGQIFSLTLVGFLSSKTKWRPHFALLSLLLAALCFFFFSWINIPFIPPVAMFVLLSACGVFNMLINGQLMMIIPDAYRSRVGSLIGSVCQAATPFGISLAGFLIDKTSPSFTVSIIGVGTLILVPFLALVPGFFAFLRCESNNADEFVAKHHRKAELLQLSNT